MLILSRKLNETIRIGNDITVTILEVTGSRIRVGIDAPSEVAVHREEVYQAISRENVTAAGYSESRDENLFHLWDRLRNPGKEDVR